MGYDPPLPEGMTSLTLTLAYNLVWVALESGILPERFRALPPEQQAELIAFHHVKNLINQFYQEEQERLHKEKLESLTMGGKEMKGGRAF